MCHVNIFKQYFDRDSSISKPITVVNTVPQESNVHCPPKVPSHTVFQKLFGFSYLKQKLNIISIDLLYTLHHHFNLPINKQYQK